jgi:hypothetical protein
MKYHIKCDEKEHKHVNTERGAYRRRIVLYCGSGAGGRPEEDAMSAAYRVQYNKIILS